jgi:FtsP/CotA-like multicopper oxidase with cupredoxin domain
MIFRFVIFLIVLGFSTNLTAGPNNNFQLTPQKSSILFPFFKTPTPVWSYNKQVPGPTIRGKEGTTIQIEVFNRLDESTSVHWHGLRIDNAMDGVPGVTQDPIAAGERFIYRLKLEEAGTFWYHPHFNAGEQLERGLKGALIVEERNKLPFTRDLVWLMDDWFLTKDGTIFPHFNTRHDLMHDGRWGNAITINGRVRPEISAAPGERIRLRLINGANARIFSVSLEGLPVQVIAVDGRPVTKIFSFKNFVMSPGNRIDLDITVPVSAAGKSFYLEDSITRQKIKLGKIQIDNVPQKTTPEFEPPTAEGFIPANLFGQIDVLKTWDLNVIRGGEYGIGWAMNRRLWPDADKAAFDIGKPVKIKFINTSGRLHPMHIHGAFFRVLEVNGEPVEEPFTRDTVLVGPRETMVIGLVPEHRGIWLTHCHIQSHADSGMMTTINVN